MGWAGQVIGARWALVIGGLPTLACGILALPALTRIDRRASRPARPAEAEAEADHPPAISSVSPAG